ncbi:hypothetical protein [Synechococcus sp. UW140]|uniref:hypothetical protein n=1 Tax=Synechococcus sp. UW140 TaxID=368503 RepID=UPI0010BD0E69|nr:hypothetical protein [Synechococcus sp. UW140]
MATTDRRARCGSGFVQIDVNKHINGESFIGSGSGTGSDPLPPTPLDSCEKSRQEAVFFYRQ